MRKSIAQSLPMSDLNLKPNIVGILFSNGPITQPWTDAEHQKFTQLLDSHAQGSESKIVSSRPLDARLDHHVLEFSLFTSIPRATLRSLKLLESLQQTLAVRVVFRDAVDCLTPPRLALFDMDSTLIQQEVIDLLAAHANVEDRVADITARAMNGELDFTASLRERVGLLKGIPVGVFEVLKRRITLTPGAQDLLTCLRALGVKTAVLSGGFLPLAHHIAGILRLDHVHANSLEVVDGHLSGKLVQGSEIVNSERKRELLAEIAAEEGLSAQHGVLAVGDGANDLPMLHAASLGIALNAKPRVQELAPCRLNSDTMLDVMYVLGYTTEQIRELSVV